MIKTGGENECYDAISHFHAEFPDGGYILVIIDILFIPKFVSSYAKLNLQNYKVLILTLNKLFINYFPDKTHLDGLYYVEMPISREYMRRLSNTINLSKTIFSNEGLGALYSFNLFLEVKMAVKIGDPTFRVICNKRYQSVKIIYNNRIMPTLVSKFDQNSYSFAENHYSYSNFYLYQFQKDSNDIKEVMVFKTITSSYPQPYADGKTICRWSYSLSSNYLNHNR